MTVVIQMNDFIAQQTKWQECFKVWVEDYKTWPHAKTHIEGKTCALETPLNRCEEEIVTSVEKEKHFLTERFHIWL